MSEECTIQLYKTREYLGRLIVYDEKTSDRKEELVFSPENFKKVMELDGLEEIIMGIEIFTIGHLRDRTMQRVKNIILNPEDAKNPPKSPWRQF